MVQQGNRTMACFHQRQIPRGTLNSIAWVVYRAHVLVNSVSILILKYRHSLPIVLMIPIVPQSAPIVSAADVISQALARSLAKVSIDKNLTLSSLVLSERRTI